MATKKSSIKRIRTNERNRQRNIAVRSRMKTYVGHALAAIESKDPEKTAQAVKAAVSEIDRAVGEVKSVVGRMRPGGTVAASGGPTGKRRLTQFTHGLVKSIGH